MADENTESTPSNANLAPTIDSITSKTKIPQEVEDDNGFGPPSDLVQFPYSTIEGGEERLADVIQIYTKNPCYCECPLEKSVGCIQSTELFWSGSFLLIVGIFYLILCQNAKSKIAEKKMEKSWFEDIRVLHEDAFLALLGLYTIECCSAWILMIGINNRMRYMVLTWIVLISGTSLAEIILTGLHPFWLTFATLGVMPLRLYFLYVVFVFAQEMKIFPKSSPIPMVRLASLRPGEAISPATASPLLIPTAGYGYYPPYYRTIDFGYYPPEHSYYANIHIPSKERLKRSPNLEFFKYHSGKKPKDEDGAA